MPENNEQREQRVLRELEGKNVAYYGTLLAAWIETRMERERAVVALSAAGIGLLVTILTTVGVSRLWERVSVIVACLGFGVAIWISLRIYELNADHLMYSLRGGNERDARLEQCDKWSKICLFIGILGMLSMGGLTLFRSTAKGGSMSSEEKDVKSKEAKESINGVWALCPPNLEIGKSLSGIGALSPDNLQSSSKPGKPGSQSQPANAETEPRMPQDGNSGKETTSTE